MYLLLTTQKHPRERERDTPKSNKTIFLVMVKHTITQKPTVSTCNCLVPSRSRTKNRSHWVQTSKVQPSCKGSNIQSTLRLTNMEVEHGPLNDQCPLFHWNLLSRSVSETTTRHGTLLPWHVFLEARPARRSSRSFL